MRLTAQTGIPQKPVTRNLKMGEPQVARDRFRYTAERPANNYCGLPDIRQAVGPGWMGLRTDRQYADQPD